MIKKRLLYLTALIILALIALVLIYGNSIKSTIADVIYDNKLHTYSCKDLPRREDVEKALEDNKEFVNQIENVAPGFIDIEVGIIDKCPARADILIYFPGHEQRERIEKLIGEELLFGIPFRMINY